MAEPVKKKKNGKEKKKSGGALKITLISVVCVIAAVVLAAGGFSVYAVYGYKDIYPGVKALGVDLSKLDAQQAEKKISEKSVEKNKDIKITVKCGDKTTEITSGDLGMRDNASDAAAEAVKYARDGSFFKRLGQIISSWRQGYDVATETLYDFSAADKKIDSFAKSLYIAPVEHSYKIVGRNIAITFGSDGYSIDADKLKSELKKSVSESKFEDIAVEKIKTVPDKLDIETIRKSIRVAPSNAQLDKKDDKNYTIGDAVIGRDIDVAQIKSALSGKTEGTYKFPFIYSFPSIKADDLEPVLFKNLLGEASTTLKTAEKNRTTNVRLAAKACDGVVLNPGENFSFNDIVGQRTSARGYKEAKIFAAGEIVDGLGGGICQVSSTLYMATLMSELEIVNRKNHMFKVVYTPIGQDATVAWGAIDYVFKNTTAYPIYISCKLSGSILSVAFYGTREAVPGREIKLESKVISSKAFKTTYKYSSKMAAGTSKVIQAGIYGYTSETYRVILQDGVEIKRDVINKSVYTPSNKIIQKSTAAATGGTVTTAPASSSVTTTTKPAETTTAPVQTEPQTDPPTAG